MKTEILIPTEENILKSAEFLKKGGVLVCPTETVYGLVANSFCEKAVEKVFEIKKRPKTKALSCNISSFEMLLKLTSCKSLILKKLMEKFWPGPLTLVVEKKKEVLDLVTANKKTVAVRFSSNEILKKLTEFCNFPLVVPSANISGFKSKTNVLEVYEELKGKVKFMLDGKETFFKKESTIIEIKDERFKILRQGAIKEEEIFKVLV